MKHTPTPWYASADGNGGEHIQSAAINEDNYVARVDAMDEQGFANADLIIKAVNNHDVLIDTLRLAYQRLRTFSPSFPEYKRDWAGDDSDAVEVIENVLQQEERA